MLMLFPKFITLSDFYTINHLMAPVVRNLIFDCSKVLIIGKSRGAFPWVQPEVCRLPISNIPGNIIGNVSLHAQMKFQVFELEIGFSIEKIRVGSWEFRYLLYSILAHFWSDLLYKVDTNLAPRAKFISVHCLSTTTLASFGRQIFFQATKGI